MAKVGLPVQALAARARCHSLWAPRLNRVRAMLGCSAALAAAVLKVCMCMGVYSKTCVCAFHADCVKSDARIRRSPVSRGGGGTERSAPIVSGAAL